MLLLVQSWRKAASLNRLLGSPSVRAELMAQTWLFALGICLWHTYSRLEHMLHACHSPRKRSGSETFTLTCSTFIAPMHQRVEVEKKKRQKKRSLGVQVGSLIVSYVLNFDDNVLAHVVFGNSGCFALIPLVPQSILGILQRKAYVSLYRLRPCSNTR